MDENYGVLVELSEEDKKLHEEDGETCLFCGINELKYSWFNKELGDQYVCDNCGSDIYLAVQSVKSQLRWYATILNCIEPIKQWEVRKE